MRLLFAEDEKELSGALTVILRHNGYDIDPVYDGAEALSRLQQGGYDAAILDIMMPKMDGLSVLRNIRSQGMQLPVLLLTAKSEVEDKVEGLDAGANDYLAKPFAAKELLARIRAMLRSAGVSQPSDDSATASTSGTSAVVSTTNTPVISQENGTLLRFGSVTLNCETGELFSPHGSVRLPNKEFLMMQMFFRHPRWLISPNRFLEEVWGYDTDAGVNVVWVYISNLRKKLNAISADITITIHRGLGYSLESKASSEREG